MKLMELLPRIWFNQSEKQCERELEINSVSAKLEKRGFIPEIVNSPFLGKGIYTRTILNN